MIPSVKHILKRINWGIPITGFTWWFAALVPPNPSTNQWFALLLLPWLFFNISFYRFVRFACWPSLIGIILLFKGELSGISLITHIFLSLSYYFFLLEELNVPEIEEQVLPEQSDIPFAKVELFIVASCSIVALSWYLFLPFNSVYILLYAAIGAANLGVWISWVSIEKSTRSNATGPVFILSLFLTGFLSHRFSYNSLFYGTLTALILFTLFSPKVASKKNNT